MVYLILASLLLAAGMVTFRVFVRRDYLRKGHLSPLSTLLQGAVFILLGLLAYTFAPSDWPASRVSPIVRGVGWIVLAGGLGLAFTAMVWLGLRRSIGQEVNVLRQSGLYRVTRNPQAVGFALALCGFTVLWPSWWAVGWVLLYSVNIHMMVLAEEEHLRRVHGQEYTRYCQRVPRYLGFPRDSQTTGD